MLYANTIKHTAICKKKKKREAKEKGLKKDLKVISQHRKCGENIKC